MAELFQKIRTQINDFGKSLDRVKKLWLVGGALFVVVLIAMILFLTRTQYVPLASDVDYADMSAIVGKLEELQIKYKDDGSNTIFVDVKDLTKAKMAIAVDLSISQPDYSWTDVFANTSFTMTSEMKQQQINQAKASALKQAIKDGIEGIKDAKVELYIAPDSNFLLAEDKESSVSVMLNLESGFSFTQKQVSGIVNFLMNSVSNLPKENITIIDQTGLTLNKFSEDSDSFIASSQNEQRMIVENQLEEKLGGFLGVIYGRTRVKVAVSVVLMFDDYQATSTAFSPPVDGATVGMIRSMATISESVVDGDVASGVPGTDSNTNVTDYPTGTNSSSDYEKSSETVNYEMNEIVTVLNQAKGTIKDIGIGIIIDTEALEENNLTDEHKKEVIDLVTSVSGIETRSVSVVAYKFAEEDAGITKFSSEEAMIKPGIPIWLVGIIIGALAVAVIAFFLINGSKANKKKLAEIAEIREIEEEKRKSELEEIQTDMEDKSSPKYQIEKFIDAKPDSVAALLRSWMNEN